MMFIFKSVIAFVLAFIFLSSGNNVEAKEIDSISKKSSDKQAIFDMHTHYKWSQESVTTPAEAIAFMDAEAISHAVVIGKPAEFALKLKRLAPKRIVAFYSPYRDSMDWFLWQRKESLLPKVEAALKSGDYQGIGELHIIGGGFAKKLDKAVVLNGFLELAVKYDVPVMIHTEFSKPNYMLAICQQHQQSKIIWAHAGAILKPNDVDDVMHQCPKVWSGMAARDPWRYVNNQHIDKNGKLVPEWKALMLKYPDRFMVGSDTVWPVDQLDSWHTADTGWQELARFWSFHRSWLAQLPEDIAIKIKRDNAMKLFKIKN